MYQVEFYHYYGEHGDLGPCATFEEALKKAEQMIEEDLNEIKYIGVMPLSEEVKFAVLFVTEYYMNKRISKGDFSTEKDYNTWMDAAKECHKKWVDFEKECTVISKFN